MQPPLPRMNSHEVIGISYAALSEKGEPITMTPFDPSASVPESLIAEEAKRISFIKSPFLQPLLDIRKPNLAFIGPSSAAPTLAMLQSSTTRYPVYWGMRVALCVAKALAVLHSFHIVHGYLRAENILIESVDGLPFAFLTGYGFPFAKRYPSGATSSGRWASTRVLAHEIPSFKDDIFAFGELVEYLHKMTGSYVSPWVYVNHVNDHCKNDKSGYRQPTAAELVNDFKDRWTFPLFEQLLREKMWMSTSLMSVPWEQFASTLSRELVADQRLYAVLRASICQSGKFYQHEVPLEAVAALIAALHFGTHRFVKFFADITSIDCYVGVMDDLLVERFLHNNALESAIFVSILTRNVIFMFKKHTNGSCTIERANISFDQDKWRCLHPLLPGEDRHQLGDFATLANAVRGIMDKFSLAHGGSPVNLAGKFVENVATKVKETVTSPDLNAYKKAERGFMNVTRKEAEEVHSDGKSVALIVDGRVFI